MNNKLKIPLRLSLAGGGTDVEPYAGQFGSEILNFTIDRFIHANILISTNDIFAISINDDPTSDFARKLSAAIVNWGLEIDFLIPKNIHLSLQTPVRPGSGLGASSAMVVASISLLNEYFSFGMTKKEIALKAIHLERYMMNIEGGFQDQFSATFTGFNFIKFHNGKYEISTLAISESFVNEFNSSLLVLDLGIDRRGEDIIQDQTKRVISNKSKTIEALHAQKELVSEMVMALQEENITKLGTLLDKAWKIKRNFSPRISTREIDLLHELLISNGAYGMKVSGAGGGGHIFALIQPERRQSLISIIENAGITLVNSSIYRSL